MKIVFCLIKLTKFFLILDIISDKYTIIFIESATKKKEEKKKNYKNCQNVSLLKHYLQSLPVSGKKSIFLNYKTWPLIP